MQIRMMAALLLVFSSTAPAQKTGPAELTALDYFQIQQLVAKYARAIDTCSGNGYDYAHHDQRGARMQQLHGAARISQAGFCLVNRSRQACPGKRNFADQVSSPLIHFRVRWGFEC